MSVKISQMAAAAALVGTEQLEVSQLSTTVTITAATISAAAADNSFNDSGSGFVTAGFAVNDTVKVTGFTGSAANNIYSATVTAVTAGKLTIGGTDGDVIVDDAAGESVTITKWNTRRVAKSDLAGTAGKHAMYIPAAAMRPSATGGCAAIAAVAISANQPDLLTLDFDATTEEYAQFSVVMPKSWNEGTVTFRAHWSHAATTTNFGAAWTLQGVAVSDDDAIGVAYGTAIAVTDAGGTTNDLYTTAESGAVTIAGTPAAEDMVFFRVFREPSNGGDTMAIDARLHGITLYVTTDAETDA